MIPKNYVEKVYAGFLGMNIGIRLGAPVEPTLWTYERIEKTYGNIDSYIKDYKNFAADDDANGPFYFLRALYDSEKGSEITPQDVARAWLNYAREGKGMFWWGGYGISTEHTAYLNVKNGIPAPRSGSIAQNGRTMAEQIGGQIFIDTWGLISPNNPKLASELGATAASVSHDGEGLNGAKFFCACIATAFCSNSIQEVIQTGLSFLPADSTYRKVAHAVIDFHKDNPYDFRACYNMLANNWGYDKYPGVCHIIPNAGVCILAMLYGDGNFNETIEIATMCGWDTDCNAGNVGTVLGVLVGIEGIKKSYREPINDGIVLSGISGYLNILDIPSYAKELSLLGYHLSAENPPTQLVDSFKENEIYFDFNLSGSTHNIRISDSAKGSIEQTFDGPDNSQGVLKVLYDRLTRGESFKLFYKPFYTREEFSDERYSPVFSGKVYSGQQCNIVLYQEQWNGNENIIVTPYVRIAHTNREIHLGSIKLINKTWQNVSFIVPETGGEIIDEIGLIVEGTSPAKAKNLGVLYIDYIRIWGQSNYTISMEKQKINFGSITPFSHSSGAWQLVGSHLECMSLDDAYSYTGNYYAKNYRVKTTVIPQNGIGHMVHVRSRGIMQGYFAGFDKKGKVSFYKLNFDKEKLAEATFNWEEGTTYSLDLICNNNKISLTIDSVEFLVVEDNTYDSGMFGFGRFGTGRTQFGDISFVELDN